MTQPAVVTTFTCTCRCGRTVQVTEGVPDHSCCYVCGHSSEDSDPHRCRIEVS